MMWAPTNIRGGGVGDLQRRHAKQELGNLDGVLVLSGYCNYLIASAALASLNYPKHCLRYKPESCQVSKFGYVISQLHQRGRCRSKAQRPCPLLPNSRNRKHCQTIWSGRLG